MKFYIIEPLEVLWAVYRSNLKNALNGYRWTYSEPFEDSPVHSKAEVEEPRTVAKMVQPRALVGAARGQQCAISREAHRVHAAGGPHLAQRGTRVHVEDLQAQR